MGFVYSALMSGVAIITLGLILCFAHLGLLTGAAILGSRSRSGMGEGRIDPGRAPTRFRVVVPAHQEEASIRTVIESCWAIDYDPGRFEVVVVADNCTDRTAEIASMAGARVFERSAPDRPGKGEALDDFLGGSAGPPDGPSFDAVLVVDADSVVDPGILRAFDRAIAGGADWLQGYSTSSNPDATRWTRLTTYALSLMNGVQLLGAQRLGIGAAFRGNGMCLTRRGLERSPWKAGGLAEDLEFTWMLRILGERIRFVPEAIVRSEMVTDLGAVAQAQRSRWGSGRKAVRSRFFVPLLKSRAIGPIRKALMLVELCSPPLVSLLLAFLVLCAIYPVGGLDPGVGRIARSWWPIHGAMAAVLAGYLVSPIFLMGIPARYLLSVIVAGPRYMAWRLSSGGRPPDRWIRTAREPPIEPRCPPGDECGLIGKSR